MHQALAKLVGLLPGESLEVLLLINLLDSPLDGFLEDMGGI